MPNNKLLDTIKIFPLIIFSSKLGYLWNLCYGLDTEEKGYVEVNYRELEEYIGISRPTFYRHIADMLKPEHYMLFDKPAEKLGKCNYRLYYVRDFHTMYERAYSLNPQKYESILKEYFEDRLSHNSGMGTKNFLRREYREYLYINGVVEDKNKEIQKAYYSANVKDIKNKTVPKMVSPTDLFNGKYDLKGNEQPFKKHKGVTTTKNSVYCRPTYAEIPNFSYGALISNIESDIDLIGNRKHKKYNDNISSATVGALCRRNVNRKIALKKCGDVSPTDNDKLHPRYKVFNDEVYNRVGSVYKPELQCEYYTGTTSDKVKQNEWVQRFSFGSILGVDIVRENLKEQKQSRIFKRRSNKKLSSINQQKVEEPLMVTTVKPNKSECMDLDDDKFLELVDFTAPDGYINKDLKIDDYNKNINKTSDYPKLSNLTNNDITIIGEQTLTSEDNVIPNEELNEYESFEISDEESIKIDLYDSSPTDITLEDLYKYSTVKPDNNKPVDREDTIWYCDDETQDHSHIVFSIDPRLVNVPIPRNFLIDDGENVPIYTVFKLYKYPFKPSGLEHKYEGLNAFDLEILPEDLPSSFYVDYKRGLVGDPHQASSRVAHTKAIITVWGHIMCRIKKYPQPEYINITPEKSYIYNSTLCLNQLESTIPIIRLLFNSYYLYFIKKINQKFGINLLDSDALITPNDSENIYEYVDTFITEYRIFLSTKYQRNEDIDKLKKEYSIERLKNPPGMSNDEKLKLFKKFKTNVINNRTTPCNSLNPSYLIEKYGCDSTNYGIGLIQEIDELWEKYVTSNKGKKQLSDDELWEQYQQQIESENFDKTPLNLDILSEIKDYTDYQKTKEDEYDYMKGVVVR